MQINKENYEIYFLDYYEKRLLPEQVAELMVFLEQNPGLKAEFVLFEKISLIPDHNIHFEKKENLKKKELIPTDYINLKNYENFLIGGLESDLTEDEKTELTAFLELNPQVKLENNFFRYTFLQPDKSKKFPAKDSLKKTSLFVVYRTQVRYIISLAASVIILLGVYFGFMKKSENQVMADRNDAPVHQIKKLSPEFLPDQNTVAHISLKAETKTHFPQISKRVTQSDREINDFSIAFMSARKIDGIQISTHVQPDEEFILNRSDGTDDLVTSDGFIFDKNQDKKEKSSFVGRLVENIGKKYFIIGKGEKKSILDYTIEGYNLMADKNVEVEKELDENGKVVAYMLDGENLSFSRKSKSRAQE